MSLDASMSIEVPDYRWYASTLIRWFRLPGEGETALSSRRAAVGCATSREPPRWDTDPGQLYPLVLVPKPVQHKNGLGDLSLKTVLLVLHPLLCLALLPRRLALVLAELGSCVSLPSHIPPTDQYFVFAFRLRPRRTPGTTSAPPTLQVLTPRASSSIALAEAGCGSTTSVT